MLSPNSYDGPLIGMQEAPTDQTASPRWVGPPQAAEPDETSLDDVRAIGECLTEAGVEGVNPISHGNAWSLCFTSPEGNGLECFVDSPFHVAQPYADGLDLEVTDEEIKAETCDKLEGKPEFQPVTEWQAAFASRLDAD